MESILSQIQRNVIYSIKQTNATLNKNQLALASGKDVQSALDSPQNYFASKALDFQANDLSRFLDGIGTSIRTIQEANIGIETMLKYIEQAEALIQEGLIELFPRTDETPDAEAIQYILDRNPDKRYFAQTNNFYQNTTDFASWTDANTNAQKAGLDGVPELKGHLATITSQEENDFVQASLTSTSWLGGSDNAVEGEWRWVVGAEEGEQFWQGVAGGSAVNGAYTNWAPGEPNQFFGAANPENYAHMLANGRWNDLPEDRNLNYIIEWGGDLLIQNPDINVSKEAMDYRREYLAMMEQMDAITTDSSYRGLNLLQKEDLDTRFNRGSTSRLETQGIDATSIGLGLTNDNFISKSEMTKILTELKQAKDTLRDYSSTLQNDLSIITSRRDFIENNINTYQAGSDDLVVADINQIGARMLALQTRQQVQFETLSLSANNNILNLFS